MADKAAVKPPVANARRLESLALRPGIAALHAELREAQMVIREQGERLAALRKETDTLADLFNRITAALTASP